MQQYYYHPLTSNDNHGISSSSTPWTATTIADLAQFNGDIDLITRETAENVYMPVAFLTADGKGVKPPVYDLRELQRWAETNPTFPHSREPIDYWALDAVKWSDTAVRLDNPKYYEDTMRLLEIARLGRNGTREGKYVFEHFVLWVMRKVLPTPAEINASLSQDFQQRLDQHMRLLGHYDPLLLNMGTCGSIIHCLQHMELDPTSQSAEGVQLPRFMSIVNDGNLNISNYIRRNYRDVSLDVYQDWDRQHDYFQENLSKRIWNVLSPIFAYMTNVTEENNKALEYLSREFPQQFWDTFWEMLSRNDTGLTEENLFLFLMFIRRPMFNRDSPVDPPDRFIRYVVFNPVYCHNALKRVYDLGRHYPSNFNFQTPIFIKALEITGLEREGRKVVMHNLSSGSRR